MARSGREWFTILDDRLRVIGPRGYPDATAAILAADRQASWPGFAGRLTVRTDRADDGSKVGDGLGRVAAVRDGGLWSGSDVVAGAGYLVEVSIDDAHARRHNLPSSTKTPAELRREIAAALGGSSSRRRR